MNKKIFEGRGKTIVWRWVLKSDKNLVRFVWHLKSSELVSEERDSFHFVQNKLSIYYPVYPEKGGPRAAFCLGPAELLYIIYYIWTDKRD